MNFIYWVKCEQWLKKFICEWWTKVNQTSYFHNYNEKPNIRFMSYVGVGNGLSYMTLSTYLFTSLSLQLKSCFAFTWLHSPFRKLFYPLLKYICHFYYHQFMITCLSAHVSIYHHKSCNKNGAHGESFYIHVNNLIWTWNQSHHISPWHSS
jgi:hypothetical protein